MASQRSVTRLQGLLWVRGAPSGPPCALRGSRGCRAKGCTDAIAVGRGLGTASASCTGNHARRPALAFKARAKAAAPALWRLWTFGRLWLPLKLVLPALTALRARPKPWAGTATALGPERGAHPSPPARGRPARSLKGGLLAGARPPGYQRLAGRCSRSPKGSGLSGQPTAFEPALVLRVAGQSIPAPTGQRGPSWGRCLSPQTAAD